MIEDFTITDATTREDLLARVNDLDEEIDKLESDIVDKNQQIENLRLTPGQRERLSEAANLMADLGRIHNTPKAKADWAAGQ